MRLLATICLAIALTGCGLLPDREAEAARAAARAGTYCRAIGLDPSSEKWTDCMILMMAAEKQGAAARAAGSRTTQGGKRGKQGLSLLCKDAISRGDSGGVFISC